MSLFLNRDISHLKLRHILCLALSAFTEAAAKTFTVGSVTKISLFFLSKIVINCIDSCPYYAYKQPIKIHYPPVNRNSVTAH